MEARNRDLDGVVGARIRSARTASGVSLREFARGLGVSPATMSALETGRTTIGITRLCAIGAALGVSTNDLLGQSDEVSSLRGADARPPGAATWASRPVPDADWRAYEPLVLDPVLTAALTAIGRKGYHGCTVRDIAVQAGLSVPGIYHHYRSKQDMLVALFELTMDDLLRRSRLARADARTSAERFALVIESLALFHTHRCELGFLGASEMRSLTPASRARIAALRVEQQRMVDSEVEQAVLEGVFTTARPHEAARAVVTMCTALPQWFDPLGAATPQEIADLYVAFALDLVGVLPAGSGSLG